jgi:hypothetical protein
MGLDNNTHTEKTNKVQNKYYLDNKKRIIDYQKRYYQEKKDDIKKYYLENRESIIESQKKRVNKDALREYNKSYYQQKKEAILEKSKEYRTIKKSTMPEKPVNTDTYYYKNKQRILHKKRIQRLLSHHSVSALDLIQHYGTDDDEGTN